MAEPYYPNKIDSPKDAVGIQGMLRKSALKRSLEKDKKLELYAPGDIFHVCRDKREERQNCSCIGALKYGG